MGAQVVNTSIPAMPPNQKAAEPVSNSRSWILILNPVPDTRCQSLKLTFLQLQQEVQITIRLQNPSDDFNQFLFCHDAFQ